MYFLFYVIFVVYFELQFPLWLVYMIGDEFLMVKQPGFSFDDEVEKPVIYDRDGFICSPQNRLTHISDEDIISDDEVIN